ncbi:NAD(+)/NADH kinase [bacterium]|nr:NAD(+)/NADH kinase [bacterium]
MRVMLVGQQSEEVENCIRDAKLEVVENPADAEACICYGGDGTMLGAERDFPGLPKVPIRKPRPDTGDPEALRLRNCEVLRRVATRQVQITRLPKLEARAHGHCLLALNDIFVHNANVTSAVRFTVEIDETYHFGEIVGDGLIVATPFGSSAYYRSITNSVIHVGIGLAFNNSTEPINHLVLTPDSRIVVCITRGPALLGADNDPQQIELQEGDEVEILQGSATATIWEIENLLRLEGDDEKSHRRLRWLHPRRNQVSTP